MRLAESKKPISEIRNIMEDQKHPLKPEDYLDLWKQFQEDADKAKDKL